MSQGRRASTIHVHKSRQARYHQSANRLSYVDWGLRETGTAQWSVFMNRGFVSILVALVFAGVPATLRGASAVDDATQKKIDQKSAKIVDWAKITDADKSAKVKTIAGEWLATMIAWHKDHDAEVNKLWSDWNKARSVVPKDEFPGEVIAHKIDDAYASLKPAYDDFIKKLSAE